MANRNSGTFPRVILRPELLVIRAQVRNLFRPPSVKLVFQYSANRNRKARRVTRGRCSSRGGLSGRCEWKTDDKHAARKVLIECLPTMGTGSGGKSEANTGWYQQARSRQIAYRERWPMSKPHWFPNPFLRITGAKTPRRLSPVRSYRKELNQETYSWRRGSPARWLWIRDVRQTA